MTDPRHLRVSTIELAEYVLVLLASELAPTEQLTLTMHSTEYIGTFPGRVRGGELTLLRLEIPQDLKHTRLREIEIFLGGSKIASLVCGPTHPSVQLVRMDKTCGELHLDVQHVETLDIFSSKGEQAGAVQAGYIEEVEVRDPDTGNQVGVSIFKAPGGGMVGIDTSYTLLPEGRFIPSPFGLLDLGHSQGDE